MPRPLAIHEQRAHPRISAPATAWVSVPSGRRFELPVRDVSRGGLFLICNQPFGAVGVTVELELALPGGGVSVPLRAQIVRLVEAPQGGGLMGVGLQFVELTAGQNTALSALIARLVAGPGGERRAYPRVAHRLSVQCTGRTDVKAIVRDLSLGGVSLWLDTPVAVGEGLILFLDREGAPPLQLTGRVLATQWAREDEPYDQARIAFDPLAEETAAALRTYLEQLAQR